MTVEIGPQLAFAFMLIFARVGTIVMLMPAFGESLIPVRLRLVLALTLAFVLYPLVADSYPPLPETLPGAIVLLGGELLVGFFIGLIARMISAALQVAGSTIAFQTGLGFAQNVDPTQGQQGALFSSFLSMLGVMLIFATDLHHVFIAALHDSFQLFAPGGPLPTGDGAQMLIEVIGRTFAVGIQISAPFIAFGLIFYLGLGVLSRLMPQIQIFFLALPANIMLGLIIFGLVLGGLMTWFLGHVESSATRLLAP